jgi:hypothetical protein
LLSDSKHQRDELAPAGDFEFAEDRVNGIKNIPRKSLLLVALLRLNPQLSHFDIRSRDISTEAAS